MDVADSKRKTTLPNGAVWCVILAGLVFAGSVAFFVFTVKAFRSQSNFLPEPTLTVNGGAADWRALRQLLIREISPIDPDISLKLSQPFSSEWKALQWMFIKDKASMSHMASETIQRFALVATFIHFGLDIDPAQHCCDWKGVECEGGEPLRLNFTGYSLVGTIPISLAYVSPSLKSLDLADRQLKGTIPRACLASWNELAYLHLGGNQFTRFFSDLADTHAFDSLTFLNIENNRLIESVPSSLANWTSLKGLYLRGNKDLSGPLLEYGLPHWKAIEVIDISQTAIDGSIPDDDLELSSLVALDAADAKLSGTLPESLSTATNLVKLALGGNDLANWTGTLPVAYAALTALEYFSLMEFGRVGGTLPDTWGHAWAKIQALDLFGSYSLTGTIPPSWGNMTDLVILRLSKSGIVGTIPGELGRLTNLVELSLSRTQLEGTMPQEVCALRIEGVLKELEADCSVRKGDTSPSVHCPNPQCCTECAA
jgi:Leucine-rich repeat (LRR) protein